MKTKEEFNPERIFFTVAAAGDFLVIKLLLKESKEDWTQDHPSEAGCYIYRANQ
jgi:hypothetical protein